MALTSVPLLYFPEPGILSGCVSTGFPLFSSSSVYTITGAGNTKIGMVFPVARTGVVTHICFQPRVVTVSQPVRVGLYTVGTDGNPTSGLYGGSTSGVQSSLSALTQYEVALGASAVMNNYGQYCAMLLEFDGVSGDIGFCAYNASASVYNGYYARFSAGAWQSKVGNKLVFALKYSDGYYWSPYQYQLSASNKLYNTNTVAADEFANGIELPFGCRAVGIYYQMTASAGTDAYNFRIYDGITPIASSVVDSDAILNTTMQQTFFPSPCILTTGIKYYASMFSASATNMSIFNPTVGSNSHMTTFPGGTGIYSHSRVDFSGGWVPNILEYTPIGLIIDQIDFPTSSGGGSVTNIIFNGSKYNHGYN